MGSRILLADDSITIQKVVNLTFAEEGIEVVAVSSGDLAERRLSDISPDLVLADVFMPGKNGYELCEAIKSNPQFRNVPVVLLVGAFEPFDQVEARRVHADTHLTKPFESRILVETVRNLIGKLQQPQSASPQVANQPVEEAEPAASSLNDPLPEWVPVESSAVESRKAAETMPLNPGQIEGGFSGFHSNLCETSSDFAVDAGRAALSFWEQPTDELIPVDSIDSPLGTEDFVATDVAEEEHPVLELASDQMVVDFERTNLAPNEGGYSVLEASGDRNAMKSEPGLGYEVQESTGQTNFQPSADDSQLVHETASNLLAVDEPLGDVLSANGAADTTPSVDSLPATFEHSPITEVAPELPDSPVFSPRTSLFSSEEVTGELVAAELPLQAQALVESVNPDVGGQMLERETCEPLQPNYDFVPSAQPEEVVPDSVNQGAEAQGFESDEVLTPSVSVLPFAEEPEGESSLPNSPLDEPASQPSAEAEEPLGFAAIDHDVIKVEETSNADLVPLDVERGFEISKAAVGPEQRGADSNSRPNLEGGYELSPVVIDEIVRRVVSQISDSVIREIAWEVVPDCVERIIDQQARELLARR